MAERAKRTPKKRRSRGDWTKRFLKAFKDTGIVTEAARKANISRAVVYERRASDPEFAAAWAQIEEWATEELEQVAYKRAAEGSDTLAIFLLKARRPAVYRESVKVEHGGSIRHEVEEGVDAAISSSMAAVDRGLGVVESAEQAPAAGEPRSEAMAGNGASRPDPA